MNVELNMSSSPVVPRKRDDVEADTSMEVKSRASHCSMIDSFPMPKERSKKISALTTKLCMLVLDLEWDAFEQYTSRLSRRYVKDPNVRTLCDIYRIDQLRNKNEHREVISLCSNIESLANSGQLSQSLYVRYLTSKSITLFFADEQEEALAIQKEALMLGDTQAPSNVTAFNLTIYALHRFLHRTDRDGHVVIPTQCDWEGSEAFYSRACEQHLTWTKDLEDVGKIPENVCASFFLYSFVRYIFSLVRSCVAGGFIYFDCHRIPEGNLEKAEKCIERIKAKEDILSNRIKVEFALVQCDFFLRKADTLIEKDRANMYRKAKSFAHEALDFAAAMLDQRHSSCCRYATIRLQYIQRQLHTRSNLPVSRMIPSDCSYVSHLCWNQSCPAQTPPVPRPNPPEHVFDISLNRSDVPESCEEFFDHSTGKPSNSNGNSDRTDSKGLLSPSAMDVLANEQTTQRKLYS